MIRFSTLAAAASFAVTAPAAAQLPDGGIEISGEAFILSDYRYRGVSRSDGEPAVQGSLTVQADQGIYAGARGTSLDIFGNDDFEDLGVAQLDLYAGYGRELGLGTSVDAGLLYYLFPDGDGGTDYFEPYASVSHQLGPVEATAGAKYAWRGQPALGGEDVLYLFGEVEAGIPMTPVTFTAGGGRQEAGGLGGYWNWSLGARGELGPVTAGLSYVDTDLPPELPNVDAGLVLSLGVGF